MSDPTPYDLTTGAGLIACPSCDALHVEEELEPGETARCIRCNAILARPRAGAFSRIIALSFTSLVLIVGAIFFPFLEISRMGIGNATSLFGVALAFSQGWLMPLTVAVLVLIVALPALRAVLLVYTLLPLAMGRAPGTMPSPPCACPRRCGRGRWPRSLSSEPRSRWSRSRDWPASALARPSGRSAR
ncbi:paraquat-inducible protein A [Paracoccus sp. DMF-8]|uniref:paraquat-inducible protein A n=1 Tax=Paracoccus sp. DMF-8 TaxID=3019445 RepID=UPI0023E3C15A|nr:paraquat-inducible protein A [Paracoccus sp. DMF-8]MDF3607290.1 paraquat-inducible protein A [Paracoccus sp. DMF-8]